MLRQSGRAKAERIPLEKSKVVLRSPETYEERVRLNPKTGKEVSFDPRPRIEVVDAKAGKYIFKWIGYIDAGIPGYEEFPVGVTIGPAVSSKTLSASDRANGIRERLSEFEKVGWITTSARYWYDKNLRNDDWDLILNRAQQDLNAEQITSEIFALLQTIRQ